MRAKTDLNGGQAPLEAPAQEQASDLPLHGVRVLDLADASAFLAGRALADLGADVVKVEPPEGDASRAEPPFADDVPGPDRSLVWLAGNVNKRGITCRLDSEGGRALFLRLVEQADVVIESFPVGYLDGLGLGFASLSAANPSIVLTSVTAFGQTGPFSDREASDLEITASSGSLWLAGDRDRPPVRNSMPQSPGWTGMSAASGTLMALLVREMTGRGQHVDVSKQASMVPAISHAPAFWDLLGEEQMRSGAYLTGRSVTGADFRNIWPCRDGYVTFALYGGPAGRQTTKALVAWMEERGGAPDVLKAINWDEFDVATVEPATARAVETAIEPFFADLTKAEFFAEVVKRNMLGYPVATVADIAADEQLQARAFWQEVRAPWGADSVRMPGSFALFDGARPELRRSAPLLGEHNVEVYRELGLDERELAALRATGDV